MNSRSRRVPRPSLKAREHEQFRQEVRERGVEDVFSSKDSIREMAASTSRFDDLTGIRKSTPGKKTSKAGSRKTKVSRKTNPNAHVAEDNDVGKPNPNAHVAKDDDVVVVDMSPQMSKYKQAKLKLKQEVRRREEALKLQEQNARQQLLPLLEDLEISRYEAGLASSSDEDDSDMEGEQDFLDHNSQTRNPDDEAISHRTREWVNAPQSFGNDGDQPQLSAQTWVDKIPDGEVEASREAHHLAALALNMGDRQIVTFSGDPADWPNFLCKFKNRIHDNPALNNSQRLEMLEKYLGTAPKARILGYLHDGQNYGKAMRLLQQNYGNPSRIVAAWTRKVRSFAPIKSNIEIPTLVCLVAQLVQVFESQGFVEDLHSSSMIEVLREKIPYFMHESWGSYVARRGSSKADVRMFYKWLITKEDALRHSGQLEKSGTALPPGAGPGGFKRGSAACEVCERNTPEPGSPDDLKQVNSNQSRTIPNAERKITCQYCGEAHFLDLCQTFLKLTPTARLEWFQRDKKCFLCVRQGHDSRACLSRRRCTQCLRRHHVVLHEALIALVKQRATAATTDATEHAFQQVEEELDGFIDTNASSADKGKSFLPILHVVAHNNGIETEVSTLLDCGSNATLVSRRIATILGLKGPSRKLSIGSVARDEPTQTSQLVKFQISNKTTNSMLRVTAWVVDHINVGPQRYPRRADGQVNWTHLAGMSLEDTGPVELIVGTDLPEAFIQVEVRSGPAGSPVGVLGHLGWYAIGEQAFQDEETPDQVIECNTMNIQLQEVHDMMERFWSIEQFGCRFNYDKPTSLEDSKAVQRMQRTIRKVEGRYEIEMLWKDDNSSLPLNKPMVVRRFKILENMLNKRPEILAQYQDIHKGYIEKGYLRKLSEAEISSRSKRTNYIPHQPHKSIHKKVRSVNDCRAKYQGVCLNDRLVSGPQLTSTLYGVFTRGRFGDVVVKGDISEMFYRTRATKKDQDSLRILAKEDYTKPGPPAEYALCVHIFGAKCSPSIASFALQQTARDCDDDRFSDEAIKAVSRDFYVDDFIKAFSTESDAIRISKEVQQIVSNGGFQLHKWESNRPEVTKTLDGNANSSKIDREIDLNLDEEDEKLSRTLGIYHSLKQDVFTFKTSLNLDKVVYTKRGLLSAISTIFDHAGFLLPFTLILRLLLQHLWEKHLTWDNPVDDESKQEWQKWLSELTYLPNVQLSRGIWPKSKKPVRFRLHTFSDASEKAYAAVTYIQTELDDGSYHCTILLGRARVAPVKKKCVRLPRLELQAAVLAVREAVAVTKELNVDIAGQYFWVDSNIVLQSIRNESKRFKTFEANRLSEIHESTDVSQFMYVPGSLNPADDATRGLPLSELVKSDHRWLNGPKFLWTDDSNWPTQQQAALTPEDAEMFHDMTRVSTASGNVTPSIDSANYSKISKLLRITAWCCRFCVNFIQAHRKLPPKTGPLDADDNRMARVYWIKEAQSSAFNDEINRLKEGKIIPNHSRLASFSPFIDERGILRMRGRLENSYLPFEMRHPMILPHEDRFVNLLVRNIHARVHHFGLEYTIAEIRQKYWVTNIRSLVKKVLLECRLCHRRRAQPCTPKMGQLPKGRVNETFPFSSTGLDYMGPFMVKIGRRREKRWVCLFTCLTTRAVHLEVCNSLSTDSFIMALRRFQSRRGDVTEFWSDNGTNFVGGNKELGNAITAWNSDENLRSFLSLREIKWNFTSPKCPHAGGAWERLVRSTKTALKTVLNPNCVPHEDTFITVLCEVENTLNSRPLTANSTNPHDYTALTPKHFLINRATVYHPTVVYDSDKFSKKRWRFSQLLTQHIWKRFRREYLPGLNLTRKWRTGSPDLKIGDIVLLVDEDAPRGCWPLGRVVDINVGTDGHVRVVNVRTASGTYVRPAHKICFLEGRTT